jgi:hypothetical protein
MSGVLVPPIRYEPADGVPARRHDCSLTSRQSRFCYPDNDRAIGRARDEEQIVDRDADQMARAPRRPLRNQIPARPEFRLRSLWVFLDASAQEQLPDATRFGNDTRA